MSKTKIDRRSFLKVLGLGGAGAALAGCDMPSYVTLEEGEEKVYSYLSPEEYVIPGIGVWYASTCLQCPAACGVHGRVREGRALKLEGSPDTRVNAGKLCQMGQASLQAHYNPDRLTTPLIKGQPATWDDALALIAENTQGDTAWMTGAISGHQRVLMDAHLVATGAATGAKTGPGRHYAVEIVEARPWEDACERVLGDAHPAIHLNKAGAALALGADMLGTWLSPVNFMGQYGQFRAAPRGVLMAVEPAMSLTGANADHWVAARPGSEAAVALAVGNVLMAKHGLTLDAMPNAATAFAAMTPARAAAVAGAREADIVKIADTLAANRPSVVLAGADFASARAALALNVMLGNVGETLTPGATVAAGALAPVTGSSADLFEFAQDAKAGRVNTLFVTGANPVFAAPAEVDMATALGAVDFKVAIAGFADETTQHCDVVLPLASALEDWGTHVPAFGAGAGDIHMQQPLMEPLYADARGFGDILLALGKTAGVEGLEDFEDYYGYLRTAVSALIGSDLEGDWNAVLQKGVVTTPAQAAAFGAPGDVALSYSEPASQEGLRLVTPARQGLYDGRHANLPWLQEAPDQISKAVWDSWAEINPKTAAKLGVKDGDYVTVQAPGGSVTTRVFTYRGVHPDVVAVPIGRGHTAYGPYADNGVNPLSILGGPAGDRKSTTLLGAGAAATVAPTGKSRHLVKLMDTDQQHGRKLVATITAQQFHRNTGGA